MTRPLPRRANCCCNWKRPRIKAVENKRPSYKQEYKTEYKQERKSFLVLLPFLFAAKKATALLEQWVKASMCRCHSSSKCLLRQRRKTWSIAPTTEKKSILSSNTRPLKNSSVRNSRQEKLYSWMRELYIHERSFQNHDNGRGKGQVMVVSVSARDTEGDVFMQPEG